MHGQSLTKLPAGLTDKGVEFFVKEQQIYCIHDEKIFKYQDIPQYILDIIDADMVKQPEAMRALNDWDLTTIEEMRKQYIFCRFGGFDTDPDISENGTVDHTEYFDCGRRGRCKQEGKLCSAIKVANGHLTKQEINVMKCIARGCTYEQCADELNISTNTVSSHIQNIKEKTGFVSIAEISGFAHNKNFV
ncbi:MAG: LuxR C-terminal-related transcriptional regulator [Pseudosphingobacterium sp.]|nr:LuxR C-terminal-related transcriptional regulator [Pseudosphingobacterium sp.]